MDSLPDLCHPAPDEDAMRGLYTDETKQLVMDVAQGNPGAFRVIDELCYFTKWYDMMQWCKAHLSGADLWEKYKDDFHEEWHPLGEWIQRQMMRQRTP